VDGDGSRSRGSVYAWPVCVLLVGRRLLAPVVADSLVSAPSARPAVRAAWMVSTTELRDAAEVALILGTVVVAVTFVMRLAGPAPRDRPA
jgi:hypothetical protein